MTHTRKTVLRETYMQHEGDMLAAWLNEHPRSPLTRHIKYFLVASEATVNARDTGAGDLLMRLKNAMKETGRSSRQRKQVEPPAQLFNPARSYDVKVHLDFRPRPDGSHSFRVLSARPADVGMLLLIQLGMAGQIQRLRTCVQCRRWLFARRGIQKFCSVACQRKFFKSTKSWKKKRKLYMRQYRATLKSKPNLVVGENRKKGEG